MNAARVHLDSFEKQHDARALEDAIADAGNRVAAEIMKTAFLSLDTGEPWVMRDGLKYRREEKANKRVMTSFGAIVYRRYRYRCKGHPSFFPADRRVGLVERFWTPRAARIALHLLSSLPPRECIKIFRERGGMCPSVSSLVRLYEAAGQLWEEIADEVLAAVRAQEDIPADTAVLTIQMDGVMVPMGQEKIQKKQRLDTVEWREASCATLTLSTAGGELLRTVRHGRMPEKNKRRLKQLVKDEVAALLARRPDLKLVTVANGARDNWRFLEQAFPQAEQVLDFFHGAGYLKEAIDLAYGMGSEQGTRRWLKLRQVLLTEDHGIDRVIASMWYLHRHYTPAVEKAIRYFENNRLRMQYARYRAQNLMIGSGLVEATNKTLVSRRMKASGMIWGQSGGQAILTLRALNLSDRFELAWPILQKHWQDRGVICICK